MGMDIDNFWSLIYAVSNVVALRSESKQDRVLRPKKALLGALARMAVACVSAEPFRSASGTPRRGVTVTLWRKKVYFLRQRHSRCPFFFRGPPPPVLYPRSCHPDESIGCPCSAGGS